MKSIDFTLREALLLGSAKTCTKAYREELQAALKHARTACEFFDLIETKDLYNLGLSEDVALTLHKLQHNALALCISLNMALDAQEWTQEDSYTINRALDELEAHQEQQRQERLKDAHKKEIKNKQYKRYRAKKMAEEPAI